jgi:hypothetical protein
VSAVSPDCDPLERAEVERQRGRQRHPLGRHVEIMRQRMADDLGLLVDFLGHEMAMVALVDQKGGGGGFHHRPLDGRALGIVDLDAPAGEDGRVAVLEIGDRVGKRGERDGIRAEIHFALAVADRER